MEDEDHLSPPPLPIYLLVLSSPPRRKMKSSHRWLSIEARSKPYSYARRDNADGNSQLLDDSDFYQQLLKEFFETIDPMSSGANSIGYLVLFVTASAFLLDLLCGSTEHLTLEN
nr:protein AATF-like isoform X1 [Ipomoea batatas]